MKKDEIEKDLLVLRRKYAADIQDGLLLFVIRDEEGDELRRVRLDIPDMLPGIYDLMIYRTQRQEEAGEGQERKTEKLASYKMLVEEEEAEAPELPVLPVPVQSGSFAEFLALFNAQEERRSTEMKALMDANRDLMNTLISEKDKSTTEKLELYTNNNSLLTDKVKEISTGFQDEITRLSTALGEARLQRQSPWASAGSEVLKSLAGAIEKAPDLLSKWRNVPVAPVSAEGGV